MTTDVIFQLTGVVFMLGAVYFLMKTPGTPQVRRYMRRAGFCLAAAATAQITVAALRTWGPT